MKTKIKLIKLSMVVVLILNITNIHAQLNGTYSIGETQVFPTINSAVDSLNQVGVSGPVLFEVDSGTYVENVTLIEIVGTSEENRITFKAKNDSVNDVIIIESYPSVINFSGADYITLKSLTIKNNTYGCVSFSGGSNYITLDSCTIIGRAINQNNRLYDVISGSNNSNDSFTTIKNCKILNGSCGIYLQGPTTNATEKGHIIEYNEITGAFVHNIGIVRVDSGRIVGNIIKNSSNTTNNNACGLILNASPNARVENNSISVHKHGIRIHNNQGTEDTSLVVNNMVTCKYSGSSYSAYPLFLSAGNKNIKIYHNNFYYAVNGSKSAVFSENHSGDNNISIINNNFISASPYAGVFNSPISKYSLLNNNFYNNGGGGRLRLNNNWYASLEEAADLIDGSNVCIDPFYISDDDLHVSNGLLGNLGLALAMVNTDFDGEPRNATTPDIGADEFEPTDSVDIAIVRGNMAPPPYCEAPDSIEITIRNIGIKSINALGMECMINGEIIDTSSIDLALESYEEASFVFNYQEFEDGDTLQLSIVRIDSVEDPTPENSTFFVEGIWLALKENLNVSNSIEFDSVFTELRKRGVCNGIDIVLEPGIYENRLRLGALYGTNSDSRITIKSSTGNREDVILAPDNSSNFVIDLEGADYITFKDFTIKSDSINSYAITFNNASTNNTFDNLHILADANGARNAIYSGSGDDHNTSIINCMIEHGEYAIEISGDNAEDSILIENNTIINAEYGIYCEEAMNVSIRSNIIRIDSSAYAYGIEIYDVYGKLELLNNQVYIDSTRGAGADIENIYGLNAQKSVIANNVFSVGGMPWAGLYLYETVNTKLLNNTIIVSSPSTSDYALYVDYGGSVDMRNNNIVAYENATALYLYNYPLGIINSNNNNLFTTGQTLVRFGGSYLQNLMDWQNLGWDLNSVSVDPEFYDLYQTCNDTLNNAGSPSEFLPFFDINGAKRNIETPDIGAAELALPELPLLGDDILMCNENYVLDAGQHAKSYSWNTGDTTQTINITSPGEYYVEIEGICNAQIIRDTIHLISAEINVDFDVFLTDYTVALKNTSTGFIEDYLWKIEDYTSSFSNEVYTFNGNGSYAISLEASNACNTAIKDTILYIDVMEINEATSTNVTVYPNPAKDYIKVDFENVNVFLVSIYQSNGTVVYKNNHYNKNSPIDLSNFSAGVYIIKTNHEKKGSSFLQLIVN